MYFILFCPEYKTPSCVGYCPHFIKERMKGSFSGTAFPPRTQSIAKPRWMMKTGKWSDSLISKLPEPFLYTRKAFRAHEQPPIYLSRAIAYWAYSSQTRPSLPHLLHISLIIITHLFCHFMSYKLDSSSLLCPPVEGVMQLGFQQELVD